MIIWGRNSHHGEGESSFLAESSLQMDRIAFYGRYENVTKSMKELQLPNNVPGFDPFTYTINNLTLGANYRIVQTHNTDLVLGALITSSMPEKSLEFYYGKTPISGEIYLRFSPSLMTTRSMNHSGHSQMKGMNH